MGTLAAQGTLTATLTTNHILSESGSAPQTLIAPSGGGWYFLRVDVVNLAAGESVQFELETAARPNGTNRVRDRSGSFYGVQSEPIKDSPLVYVHEGEDLIARLRQDGGTGRAYEWAVYKA